MKQVSKLSVSAVVLLSFCFVNCQKNDNNYGLPCVPIPVRRCPGVTPKADLVSVYIQDCIAEPCSFEKGRNVTMEMDIRFKEPVTSIHAELHALIGAIPIKWDGVDANACNYIVSEGKCPFKANAFITYGVELPVGRAFPSVTADVRYSVLDQNGDIQVCWIVRASVVNP